MANGSDHWFQRNHASDLSGPIAYLCAEYGFHESLGIYSGGLGVLAGDHMKTASRHGASPGRRRADLPQGLLPPVDRRRRPPGARLPGLRAQRGCRSCARWTSSGTRSPSASRSPAETCSRPSGSRRWAACRSSSSTPTCPRTTTRTGRSRTSCTSAAARCGCTRSWCWASAACARCGRSGLEPAVWHLNEGHSAFLLAERARELRGRRHVRSTRHGPRSAATACSRSTRPSRRATSATTPTWSAASPDRCSRATGVRTTGGVPLEAVLALGLGHGRRPIAVRHDRVLPAPDQRRERREPAPRHTANATWHAICPVRDPRHHQRHPHADLGRPADARRCSSATPTRTSTEWTISRRRSASGTGIEQDPDAGALGGPPAPEAGALALRPHGRLRNQFARHGEAPSALEELEQVLDPSILTIGFARRFATYKRAALLFTDLDRLARLVWDADRPVQLIFAGKAHPADRPGPAA